MNLQKVIQDETAEYIGSEGFKEIVKSNVKKLIDNQIESALRDYGDIGSTIKDYIKKEVSIDIGDLPATGLKTIMLETMDNQLKVILNGELRKSVIERVNLITKPIDAPMKFHDFVEQIFLEKSTYGQCYNEEQTLEDRMYHENINEIISLHIDDTRDDTMYEMWLDDTEETTRERCEYHIGVFKDSGRIVFYSGGSRTSSHRTVNDFYGVSSMLYKMQVQSSQFDVSSITEFYNDYM